jgi:hypothetical protein
LPLPTVDKLLPHNLDLEQRANGTEMGWLIQHRTAISDSHGID